jgi:hypothetical protein
MTNRSLALIGISAVIIALTAGLWCGWKIRDGAARAEIAGVRAERDKAVQETRFWQTTLTKLVEGEPLPTAGIARAGGIE